MVLFRNCVHTEIGFCTSFTQPTKISGYRFRNCLLKPNNMFWHDSKDPLNRKNLIKMSEEMTQSQNVSPKKNHILKIVFKESPLAVKVVGKFRYAV